jgi:16S rRNA (cytosine1402-N4)-methyltransferase
MSHTSVLLNESIDGLAIRQGDVFVDGTLGDGGHSAEVFRKFGAAVTIIGIDRDSDAIARVRDRFTKLGADENSAMFIQGNYRHCDKILESLGRASASRVLLDIGLSSRQLEESGRGFSFQKDEPLMMTFEPNGELTAQVVVNNWEEQNLADIIYGFGEEKYSRRIARGIVEARNKKPIETTGELVDIIKKSTPIFYHFGKIHPATRTFQAIRIAVNDELSALQDGLKAAWKILLPTGRIAVISFHSLEDRIVKNYFNELKADGTGRVITKKPIIATDEEIKNNPRSRSAKLRIIEKI